MRESPYLEDLQHSVLEAYDAFGRGRVSARLEVCLCPVCMTEQTRGRLIATPNDALDAGLIREYSNSAHGVPQALDDLRLLLPRYLDLLAQGEAVDDLGVGTGLLRFGQARAMHPGLYTERQGAVLEGWARAMIWHAAWAEARGAGLAQSPARLFEMLLCGGWAVSGLCETLEAVFDDPEIGRQNLQAFSAAAIEGAIIRVVRVAPDWFALRYCSVAVREELAGWLNVLAGSDRVLDLASEPGAAGAWNSAEAFARAVGMFDAALFPGPN